MIFLHHQRSEKAQTTLSDFIIQIETSKSVPKEKKDLNTTSEDLSLEETDNGDNKEEKIYVRNGNTWIETIGEVPSLTIDE